MLFPSFPGSSYNFNAWSLMMLDGAGLREKLHQRGIDVNDWEHFAKWLVPPANKLYIPWFTFVFTAAVLVIFAYMAGASFRYWCHEYQIVHYFPACCHCC